VIRANILVVDDTKLNLELLEVILGSTNYNVRTATNGEMALKSIKNQKPDLVLLDVMMPSMSGYEVCSIIKKDPAFQDIPVMFLSAKEDAHDKVKGFDVGAVDYITKPFDTREILVRIQTHLSVYFLQKELQLKMDVIDKYVITSTTDLSRVIIDVSEAFCEISGYSKQELIGKNLSMLKHPDMGDFFSEKMLKILVDKGSWSGEIKKVKKDNSFYWVNSKISTVYDIHKNVIGYTSIGQDITDKKRIEKFAITDELTGLYNRRYFNDFFEVELKRAIRQGTCLCFAMLDVDFFKQYNDHYGHQQGDSVLLEIGKALKKFVRRSDDTVFRLGGEEFGIIFNTKEYESAKRVTRNVLENIESLQIEHAGSQYSSVLTASLGLVCVNLSNKKNFNCSSSDLYKIADDELYNAKRGGRNRLSARYIE